MDSTDLDVPPPPPPRNLRIVSFKGYFHHKALFEFAVTREPELKLSLQFIELLLG